MKTIVVYKSKTGFAKKYAEWIASELNADLFEASKANLSVLQAYDSIVFGGGLYAGGIIGLALIKKNLAKLNGKKIAVFAVGASSVKEGLTEELEGKNFTREELKRLKFFFLRGGFNLNKLGFVDRQIMKIMKVNLSKKKQRTEDEEGMLNAFEKPVDFTDKKNIKDLLEYIGH